MLLRNRYEYAESWFAPCDRKAGRFASNRSPFAAALDFEMPRPQKIPPDKIELVKALDHRLDELLFAGELKRAKLVLDELKGILRPHHHEARIMQGNLKLLEAALESWQLDIAKRGLLFVRSNTQNSTRLFLEASALLAIAHLKEKNALGAEPLMAEVLENATAIKSDRQREIFRLDIIDRFDQAAALAALAACPSGDKTEAEIHTEAAALVHDGLGATGIQERLGAAVPQSAKAFLLSIDQLSKSMLPHEQRTLLPSPNDVASNAGVGGVIFAGVRPKLHRYLCDEQSKIYQCDASDDLKAIADKCQVASAVLSALTELRIAGGEIAAGITAMVMLQGKNDFCESDRLYSLMELRQKSK